MANPRLLVKRLKAIKNIRKITRTMELIATARFKKAMDRATEAAAYTKKIGEIVADLARSSGDITHPLLVKPETTKNSTLLVLNSNRGLCGGYNAGVLRQAMGRMRSQRKDGMNVSLEVSGKRGISYMKFQGQAVEESYTHFEDAPGFDEVEVLANRFIEEYTSGKLDRLDVAYTRFLSSARQEAVVETLLPLDELTTEEGEGSGDPVDYEFLPTAEDILFEIVPASFKARLFKCFLDAAVSEQIARMVAMKGATENADEMIGNLSQQYNRARQAQITSELAEVIGGAAALE
ncbi:ATP synthase F1 subunit gamma [Calycomorphotria hydatis]|uniref:ATP synthase gamma chain n=1 Tax=Calycomorphotria hydatis TaxID=2528027 RepID=A0A517T6I4_9PLAN|nr:ATP synthase F1 subunit gamma [Calycomorphotria hydatis]QDT63971.1 ATP synthase gamma chain [Calycomorphotria hydatis]